MLTQSTKVNGIWANLEEHGLDERVDRGPELLPLRVEEARALEGPEQDPAAGEDGEEVQHDESFT